MAGEQFIPGKVGGSLAPAVIASPYQLLVTGEDNLRLVVWAQIPGGVVTLNLRTLGPDGTIQVTTTTLVTQSLFSGASTLDVPVAPGYILNAALEFAVAGPATPSLVYARLDLIRGLGPAAIVVGRLIGGYLVPGVGPAFPGSVIQAPDDGPGLRWSVPIAGTLGTDWTFQVPANLAVQVFGAKATLATSAVAGNRTAYLRANVDGVLVQLSAPRQLHAPSTSLDYWWQAAGAIAEVGPKVTQWLAPSVRLRAFDTVGSVTFGLDAGDVWSLPMIGGLAWLDPTS